MTTSTQIWINIQRFQVTLKKDKSCCIQRLISFITPCSLENTFSAWNIIKTFKCSEFVTNNCGLALFVFFLNFSFPCDSQTVCEMTVSLSSAESHFSFKFPVVPHGLFPPWSVSGVGVQLFHQHDKWFRKLPHCSLTNRKHTRMLSTSIFHPVVCICLHLWF